MKDYTDYLKNINQNVKKFLKFEHEMKGKFL